MKNKQKAVRTALPPVRKVSEAKPVPGKAKRCAQKQVLGNAVPGHGAHGAFSDESPKSTIKK